MDFKQWNLSPLDKSVLGLVNRGSWLFEYEIDVHKLCESLQQMMEIYPLFGGRYDADKQVLSFGNDVDFKEIDCSGESCKKLIEGWKVPSRFQADFILSDFKKGKISLLSVKVVSFADGTLISVALSHVCADGASFYNFIDQWSKKFRGIEFEKPRIDQNCLPDLVHGKEELMRILSEKPWFPVGLKLLFIHLRDQIFGLQKKMSVPQFISLEKLNSLRDLCFEKTGERYGNHVLFCAILAKMFAVLNDKQNLTRYSVVSVVDLRGCSSIPREFVGNAVLNVPVGSVDISVDICAIAKQINENLKQKLSSTEALDEGFLLTLESIEHKVPFVGFDLMANCVSNPTCLMVNNFCKFPIYSTDFGGGFPIKVFPNDLPDTIKIFPAAPSEKGYYFMFQGNVAVALKNINLKDCC